ncbi:MAG: hypothetical protein JXR77_09515 [Lentisphaeria bacterium]|nr:hypothetical protein [Lentisphaeria bacterium]
MVTDRGGGRRFAALTGVVWTACLWLLEAGIAMGQLTTYTWPAQATFSDRYRVFVTCGDAPEREVQVLMSLARHGGDYRARELEGRTFSFVPLSFAGGEDALRVRVVEVFGSGADGVRLSPRRYGLEATLSGDGREAVFRVDSPNRYLSVDFEVSDNRTATEAWIKHMFCLFVDPPETEVPERNAPDTVVYAPEVAPEALRRARLIVFPRGHHPLWEYGGGGMIEADGRLRLQDGQALYLEGGAFVEGLVAGDPRTTGGQRIYGRGILSGRHYLWRNHPDHSGPAYPHILGLGNRGRVEGITILDSPNHGIVGWTTAITNVKLLGWHCNNDAVRVGSGSEISHCFFRAVDDHFYNFHIHVHDVVLWAGHNGAILTYGWGGEPGDRTYNAGASLLEDIDIIHPEWTALGNNNGLVAAQVGLDFRPHGYGGDTTTVLRNIRIEGTIPGLVNLKPRSGREGITAVPVANDRVGYLGDLVLENITVDGQSGRGVLRGKPGAAIDGEGTFLVRNVTFRNVRIGGETLTDAVRDRFLDIDPATTRDLHFPGE